MIRKEEEREGLWVIGFKEGWLSHGVLLSSCLVLVVGYLMSYKMIMVDCFG